MDILDQSRIKIIPKSSPYHPKALAVWLTNIGGCNLDTMYGCNYKEARTHNVRVVLMGLGRASSLNYTSSVSLKPTHL